MSKPAFNIFGDIVANDADRWFESDIVPAMVFGWLAKQDGDVEININSNGGDVAAGLAIANAIKGYKKGDVTCNVLGVAASMASVVACAGKHLAMGEGAFLMVHNPWTVTVGDAEDLRKDADVLDKMRDSILGFYQSKLYGKTADEIKALMDAETWLNPDDARAFGFLVDDYAGGFKAAASLTRRAFASAPAAARALVLERPRPAKAAATDGGTSPTSPATDTAPEEHAAPAAETTGASGTQETPPPSTGTQAAQEPQARAVSPETASPADDTKSEGNWEARFRGLSAKYNEAQKKAVALMADAEKKAAAALAARDAEIATLKNQLEQGANDLAAAKAKASELSARLDEQTAALRAAEEDLAQTRDSLRSAEDKAAKLESTRDLLTAGVLTPPDAGCTYAEQMKTAKGAAAREALRAKKREGKIK